MKRYLFLTLLALVCLAPNLATAQATDPDNTVYSLNEAVQYAMENATEIRNARVDILDAEQNVKENRSRGLPQINASLDYQYFIEVPVSPLPESFKALDPNSNPDEEATVSFQRKHNFVSGLSAQTMIFDGSFFVGLRAARASRAYYNLELENAERRVRRQVTQAYFPVLLLKTNADVLNNNIDNLEKLLEETRAQYEAGFVEKLDVDRLRLSISNLKSQRNQLLDRRENALRALKFTINYPLDQPLEVNDDLESIERSIEQTALEGDIPYNSRPELRLLDQTIKLQDLNIELQKAAYLPTAYASLSGQYQFQGDTLSSGFWAPTVVAGVNVNIPIYDFGGRSARVQRAKLAKQKVVNQRGDVNRSIQLEVLNARSTFTAANNRFRTTKENLELAEEIYEVTQIKYNAGVGSSIEVVQAEQALYDAQANYMQSLYDTLVAREDLFLSLGR